MRKKEKKKIPISIPEWEKAFLFRKLLPVASKTIVQLTFYVSVKSCGCFVALKLLLEIKLVAIIGSASIRAIWLLDNLEIEHVKHLQHAVAPLFHEDRAALTLMINTILCTSWEGQVGWKEDFLRQDGK